MLLRISTAGPCATVPPPSYRWYIVSARSSGRSTAWAAPAASVPPTRPAISLVAATTAPLHAGRAACAFAHRVDVVALLAGQLVERALHDRIGEPLALVGLDPRLDRLERAAAEAAREAGQGQGGEAR